MAGQPAADRARELPSATGGTPVPVADGSSSAPGAGVPPQPWLVIPPVDGGKSRLVIPSCAPGGERVLPPVGGGKWLVIPPVAGSCAPGGERVLPPVGGGKWLVLPPVAGSCAPGGERVSPASPAGDLSCGGACLPRGPSPVGGGKDVRGPRETLLTTVGTTDFITDLLEALLAPFGAARATTPAVDGEIFVPDPGSPPDLAKGEDFADEDFGGGNANGEVPDEAFASGLDFAMPDEANGLDFAVPDEANGLDFAVPDEALDANQRTRLRGAGRDIFRRGRNALNAFLPLRKMSRPSVPLPVSSHPAIAHTYCHILLYQSHTDGP